MSYFRVLTLVVTAVALMPSLAHLAALPNKITMTQEDYFTVQRIYAGWWQFGIVIMIAILCNCGVAFFERNSAPVLALWALASAVLIALSLVVFAIWVRPANASTQAWTVQPENWKDLRRQWEYGHAAGAIIMSLAFISTCFATTQRM